MRRSINCSSSYRASSIIDYGNRTNGWQLGTTGEQISSTCHVGGGFRVYNLITVLRGKQCICTWCSGMGCSHSRLSGSHMKKLVILSLGYHHSWRGRIWSRSLRWYKMSQWRLPEFVPASVWSVVVTSTMVTFENITTMSTSTRSTFTSSHGWQNWDNCRSGRSSWHP